MTEVGEGYQIEEGFQRWKTKNDILNIERKKTVLKLREKLDALKQEHQQTLANLLKLEGAIAIVAKLIEEETGEEDV